MGGVEGAPLRSRTVFTRERERKILTYVCKHHTNYHLTWRNLGAAAAGTEGKKAGMWMSGCGVFSATVRVASNKRCTDVNYYGFSFEPALHLCLSVWTFDLRKPA